MAKVDIEVSVIYRVVDILKKLRGHYGVTHIVDPVGEKEMIDEPFEIRDKHKKMVRAHLKKDIEYLMRACSGFEDKE